MYIDQVEILRLHMPLKTPFEGAWGTLRHKDVIIVKVYAEDCIGYGEGVALPDPVYTEETAETIWYMLQTYLIPDLFKKASKCFMPDYKYFTSFRRHYMAKASLEMALWDCYSKSQGKTLSEQMKGTRKHIPVGISIGLQSSTKQLLQKVEESLQEGYQRIKIKIKPDKDIQLVKAIRHQFGSIPLMVDANSAYQLKDLAMLKELDEYELLMIEQPLAQDDIIEHAQLQEQLNTPICLDESIETLQDAKNALLLGSCQVMNIKLGRVGGWECAKQIHDLCWQRNIPVWCGGMLESGVGRAHNIALSSLPGFSMAGDVSPSQRYWIEDIVEPEIEMNSQGFISVPNGYGLGYDLNEQVIDKYVIDRRTYRV